MFPAKTVKKLAYIYAFHYVFGYHSPSFPLFFKVLFSILSLECQRVRRLEFISLKISFIPPPLFFSFHCPKDFLNDML